MREIYKAKMKRQPEKKNRPYIIEFRRYNLHDKQ